MKIKKYYHLISLITLFLIFNCKSDQKDILLDMNNILMPNFEELKSNSNSKDTLRILIIGNSITSHGVANEIGWTHKSGMAASSSPNDYVHLLFNNVSKANPDKNVIFRFANYASFERSNDKVNIQNSKFLELFRFNPMIIIYQLGDNISTSNVEVFTENSINFLNKFKDSKKIIVSPFFVNRMNFSTVKDICKETNSKFVDISSVSKNEKFRANNDHNSKDKKLWKADGIGIHPGDLGMLEISNIIFKNISQIDHE